MITYVTEGTCASEIRFQIDAGFVRHVEFIDGCQGNLQAISKLVEGMPVDQVIVKLKGICCGDNPTSCADQLAKALENALK